MKTFWNGLKAFFVELITWVLSLIVQQKFWAVLLALVVFLIQSKYPEFQLDIALMASVLVLMCVYLVSLLKDPGPNTWKKIFSRKLLGYVLSLVAMVLQGFGIIELWGISLVALYGFLGSMGLIIITSAFEQPQAEG
jgi:hypothetical protein